MAKKDEQKTHYFLGESIPLLYGENWWVIRGIPRLKVEPVRMSDGPSGLRKESEGASTYQTETTVAYPSSALMACSFDREVMEEYGVMLGRECRHHDVQVLLGPGVNIKRNPLCGRNFEYYSEDPYLSGKMAASFIKGIQSVGVGACIKHFACNSQESYRMVTDSIVDLRALHEIYLRPFQIAIEDANPWMVMASYNKVNGTYACENEYLLNDVLRTKWNYDGVVVSDWGAVNDPIKSHEHGLDVEMPCFANRSSWYRSIARVNKSFARAAKKTAGHVSLLSRRTHNPYVRELPFDIEAAHNLSVKMAERSMVLVRNEENILPFPSFKDVAIIGSLAAKPRIGGGGSSHVEGYRVPSFLDVCRAEFPDEDIHYSPGYASDPSHENPHLLLDALELASKCKKVLYFMGTFPDEESEGFDRPNLRLSEKQMELFNHLLDVNPNIVVVLFTGAPVESTFLAKAKGAFFCYFPGEGGSEALRNLLLGRANPSGHLAETWPKRNYEVPSFGFYPGSQVECQYRESIYVGYRYYVTAHEEANYYFGHGLSYSQFEYTKLTLSSKHFSAGERLVASVTVKNVSKVAGTALVQLYVEPRGGLVYKAKRTLQGFQRVFLEPGKRAQVDFELDAHAFEHYDTETKSFQIEADEYMIEVGNNCNDIALHAYVDVASDAHFHKVDIHVYNEPPKDGFWQYDDAFEGLLGHVLPIIRDPRLPPYTINSTFRNIDRTFIGKKLIAAAEEKFRSEGKNVEVMMKSFLDMPIRSVTMGGVSEKKVHAIVDMANKNYIKAFFHLFFRKRYRG